MQIFSSIIAIVKLVPIFDKWFQSLITLYVAKINKEHEIAFVKSLKSLIDEKSQIPLEEAMGNDNAGKPADRRDDVQERDRKTLLLVFISFLLVSSCVSRTEVEADTWLTERLPEELCERVPEIKQYGIFRVIECKRLDQKDPEDFERWKRNCEGQSPEHTYEEFIPYCSKTAGEHVTMHREDFNKWMEKLTKPKQSVAKKK